MIPWNGVDSEVCPLLCEKPWRAVVFDLDQTTGSWGLGSLAFQVFLRYGGNRDRFCQPFVRCYLQNGGARPWLLELLQGLHQWKEQGRIDEVAIFTAASNQNGWVTFLRDCMELYAGVPGLFGKVVSRETSPLVCTENGTRTVKDLSMIGKDANQVVLIDDKPQFVLNGYVIGVPEYNHEVCAEALRDWIESELPAYASQIHEIFAADELKHSPHTSDCSQDSALREAAAVLNLMFPGCGSEACSPCNISNGLGEEVRTCWDITRD